MKLEYEETPDNNKKRKIFKKKELNMEAKVKSQVKHSKTEKKKSTLSIYTYLNFKQFGLAVRIDDGIKTTVLWFETHIKFEKR